MRVKELSCAFHMDDLLQQRSKVGRVIGKVDLCRVHNQYWGLVVIVKKLCIAVGEGTEVFHVDGLFKVDTTP